MYFILTILFMLSAILSIIFYKALNEVLIPKFMASSHAARLSRVIHQLMVEVRDDWWAHLQTICEHDGDEPFEPFLDSPLHTCPPTEFCFNPPKEETNSDANNNNYGNGAPIPPRRRRPRIVLPVPAPNGPQAPFRPPAQQRGPNPAVVVRRLGVRHRPLVRDLERLGQDVDRQINEVHQIAVGVRRVLELRELGLRILSPPPQENEGERFQFD